MSKIIKGVLKDMRLVKAIKVAASTAPQPLQESDNKAKPNQEPKMDWDIDGDNAALQKSGTGHKAQETPKTIPNYQWDLGVD